MTLIKDVKSLIIACTLLLFSAAIQSCKDSKKEKSTKEAIADQPPNIVLIYVDDMGYGDLSSYGQGTLQTPNIDQLAKEGMLFTQHYAGNTVCAPSRAAMLTGKHTGHTSVRGNAPEGQLLENEELTIAEMLKKEGYRTGIVGKWGVGNDPEPDDPMRNGFDHAYGYINMWHAHNFYPEFLYRNGEKEVLEGNVTDSSYDYAEDMKEGTGVAKNKETYVLDKFQEDALGFIETNKDKPFFLYYALNMPHANNEAGYFTGNGMEVPSYGEFANEEWPEGEKGFAQMIHLIDQSVKGIEEKLEALGISDNTMVLFASDNGPHNEAGHTFTFFDSNGIYRGSKRDLYEGGIRVPLIVKWPGKIKPGVISDLPTAQWDFLPTFADIIDYQLEQNLDGISFLPTLLGDTDAQEVHGYLYWEFYEQGGKQAVLADNWKYIKLNVRDSSTPVVKELYDLRNDPSESNNIIEEFPEKHAKLDSIMNQAHEPHDLLSLFSDEANAETKY